MTKIKIVTDSSAQLSAEEIKNLNITVIPMNTMIDNTIYIDGVSITKEEFLEMMKNSPVLPKTSQPPIGTFIETYDALGADGSKIISIHVSGDLSGTVHTAYQAAQMTASDVTFVDSRFTERALSFQVLTAAKMALQGANETDILATIDDVRKKSALYICVMNLDNLIKGGRINKTIGNISTFLNMKVTLAMKDGVLVAFSKGRGLKSLYKSADKIIDEMKQASGIRSIGISHVGGYENVLPVINKMKESFPNAEFLIDYTSPSVMTHAGPGAFALMYETE